MRTDPSIEVTCDRCTTYTEQVGLTATAGHSYDERNVDRQLIASGWRVQDGQDICPDCKADEDTP